MNNSQNSELLFALNQRNETSLIGVYLTQFSSLFAAIKKFDGGNSHISALAELGEFLAEQQADLAVERTENIDNLIQNLKAIHHVSNT